MASSWLAWTIPVGLLLLPACGDDDADPGMNGGSSGSAGAPASGGTASSSGGATNSGGTSSGGLGSSVGGTNTGGTNTGGTNTGGTSGGSSGDACRSFCTGVAGACPALGEASCQEDCDTLDSKPECDATASAFFSCAEDADVECGDTGYRFLGCETEQLALSTCVLAGAVDPTLAPLCEEYCANESAAQCPESSSVEECELACGAGGSLIPGCEAAWKALVECGASSTITCDEEGAPAVDGCADQSIAYLACLLASSGNE